MLHLIALKYRIMFRKITLLFYLSLQTLYAQHSMQHEDFFKALEAYPSDYSSGNIVTRWMDGIGYRYYWATEGLRTEDFEYTPSASARTTLETMEHIHGLAAMLADTAEGKVNLRPLTNVPKTASELRSQTLLLLFHARQAFANRTASDLEKMKLKMNRNGNEMEFPLWHLFNGPGADALYHIGQLVSFRRSSGNPMHPKVNVFMGKNNN
jgi:hypothetical protein